MNKKIKWLKRARAGGKLVICLEGGYSQHALSESVAESFLGLLGEPSAHAPEAPEAPEPAAHDVVDLVRELAALHKLSPVGARG